MGQRRWNETFIFETTDSNHCPEVHWSPFFEDGLDKMMDKMCDFLNNSRKVHTYSDLLPAPVNVPGEWPCAFYRAWPDQQGGVQFVMVNRVNFNEVVAMFPFVRKGVQHSITINEVVVFETGVEAQIACTILDAAITFYDIFYASNRAWYETGNVYQFMITGIAYECRVAKNDPLLIDPPPQWLRGERIKGGEGDDGKDPGDPMVMHIDGMAAFLEMEEYDRDDYAFHGPVKNIREIEIMDQPAWLFQTTVIRNLENDTDLDIEILVTRKVWGDMPLPKIGEDIEGTLWLQGYLFHPGPPENEEY